MSTGYVTDQAAAVAELEHLLERPAEWMVSLATIRPALQRAVNALGAADRVTVAGVPTIDVEGLADTLVRGCTSPVWSVKVYRLVVGCSLGDALAAVRAAQARRGTGRG